MNSALIHTFYTAFQQRDWQTMNSCYHAEATFYDPAFRHLNSTDTKAMWHMLCLNAKDFELQFSNIKNTGDRGSCHWQASYAFSKTGRRVNNEVQASFTFKDGLILTHSDEFDLWKWSRMALGLPGLLLGWTPYLKHKINQNALKSLKKFKLESPS
ncbi:MAG: nuclear transport factor 2 family protein [Cyclobacteriaceae bacterium]|jgi:ketosteroid isomerase-like protein|nr:nuclear transport factor 2 family protein [Cyclobacteriaceae bacterium]